MFQPKAKVLAHSRSAITGKEIVTFEVEFWRGVLAEFNTHNALSKNTSSSRAIPVPTMINQVRTETGGPARFGAANTGMQDSGAHRADIVFNTDDEWGNQLALPPVQAWLHCARASADLAQAFHDAGYAKQVCNRLIEPYQTVKMVVTATDLANFFWLRDHYMADPSIDALAKVMKAAYKESEPVELMPGDWHVPYYGEGFWKAALKLHYGGKDLCGYDEYGFTLKDALAISASCCAQASYRKLDDTIEKAKGVVSRLNLGVDLEEPCHASPTEHQATPVGGSYASNPSDDTDGVNLLQPCTWQDGITHMTREGEFCSGNLKGFIQHRQLIPGNTYTGEIK